MKASVKTPLGAGEVAVVVINYRKPDHTLACVLDLEQCETEHPLAILVIDNGSDDDSAERLTNELSDASRGGVHRVELLLLDRNTGFCKAVNRGVQWAAEAQIPYVLLLNNDMRVPADFISPMVDVLRNVADVGCVGPTVLTPDGKVWAEGGKLGFAPNLARLRHQGQPPVVRSQGPRDVAFVPGACMLMRTAEVAALGGMDESYFMYWEDVDLCRRLADRGLRTVWVPWVRVQHDAGTSGGGRISPLRKFFLATNEVRYLKRHGSLRLWSAFALFDCLMFPAALFMGLMREGGVASAWAKGRGLVLGLFGHRPSAADVHRYLGSARSD